MPIGRSAPIRALREEASSRDTSPNRLAELASNASKTVRLSVAGNPAVPWHLLVKLANDPEEQIRVNAASSVAHVRAAEEPLSKSHDKWVRAILAHTYARQLGALSRSVQVTLADDDFPEVRARIAETTNFLDIFEKLMGDSTARVRAGCAANPRIDRTQMERLIGDRLAGVRAATVQIGCLFPDDEQLLRLARDKSAGVQWAVLNRVDAPLEAVEIISTEGDEFNRQQAAQILANVDLHRTESNIAWRASERLRASPGSFESSR